MEEAKLPQPNES